MNIEFANFANKIKYYWIMIYRYPLGCHGTGTKCHNFLCVIGIKNRKNPFCGKNWLDHEFMKNNFFGGQVT